MQEAAWTQYDILKGTRDGLTRPEFVTKIVCCIERRHLRGLRLVIFWNVAGLNTSKGPTAHLRTRCYWYQEVLLGGCLHHMRVAHV